MKEYLLEIIKHYGEGRELKKLSEYVYELQEAILTDVGDIESYDNITTKLANVYVILSELEEYFEIDQNKLISAESSKILNDIEMIKNEKTN